LNRGMLYPYQPVGAYRCVKMLGIEKLWRVMFCIEEVPPSLNFTLGFNGGVQGLGQSALTTGPP
jgi:hypothetical protein